MNDKQKIIRRIITVLLLLFTAVSIVFGIIKEIRQGSDPETGPVSIQGDIVFYFHGNQRCTTCEKIERITRETVSEIRKETWGSQIELKVLNREKQENAHYVKEFKIFSNAVIIAAGTQDKPVKWKNLNRIWELVGKEEKLEDYFKQEIRILMEDK